ncbi:MAG: chorismate lyase [Paraglaciecola sp.]|uniref:chorismate--pyruvate lyase family protein n=1 Tax=Pseudomonadati TaxID=3379134 RepID=UPI00273EB9E1|nr:chorismate lyase [Paraglaciecola sp.]MDP5029060.1 chorismate lyase [Paraglaciecola sp.]MDP5039257.1 chorismate lyase [Paraglaciecola sp.]MDP5129619.1 chorismate lyase [Paraglaciecola sp.]
MKTSHSFPIGLSAYWQPPERYLIPNTKLKNWLLDTGSLTERLQSHCDHFHVQLLGQRHVPVSLEEMSQLNSLVPSKHVQDWQVREVVLWGNHQPWVFARSIIPQKMCDAEFAELGEQPLGKLIFNDPRFKRMPFQLTQLDEKNAVTAALNISCQQTIWARRSIFQFSGLPMSVAELFLPQSPAYEQCSDTSIT